MFRRTVAMTVVLVGCTAGALAFASDLSRVGRVLADRVSATRGYTPVQSWTHLQHRAADGLLRTGRDSLAGGEFCRFPPKGYGPNDYSASSIDPAFDSGSVALTGQSTVPASQSGICVGEPAPITRLPRAPAFP